MMARWVTTYYLVIFALLLGALLMLNGCQTMAPEVPPVPAKPVEVVTIRVPVPVPCVPQIGPDPMYPDTREALLMPPFPDAEMRLMASPMDAGAMGQVLENLRYRVRLLAAAWPLKNSRLAEYKAAIKACGG